MRGVEKVWMVETFRIDGDWFWRRRHIREWRLVRRGTDALIRLAIANLDCLAKGRDVGIGSCCGRSMDSIDQLMSSSVALPRQIT